MTKAQQAADKVKNKVGQKLHDLWWAFLLRGILALSLAICALIWPTQTMGLLITLLGIYFLVDGTAGVIATVRSQDKRMSLLPAIVSLVAGITLVFWTSASGRIFLAIIGMWAVLQGIGMLVSWWQMERSDGSRSTVALVGGTIVAIGVAFIVWPETGVVTVAWLIAIGSGLVGILLLYLGTKLKSASQRMISGVSTESQSATPSPAADTAPNADAEQPK